jgi:alkylation response protein AidB-like acyl-CoA dehydrogenase
MDSENYDALKASLWRFMEREVYPNEQRFFREQKAIAEEFGSEWTHPPVLEELKAKAKAAGLWNLFLPVDSAELAGRAGGGLTNLQYAEICEIMGTSNHIEFAAQCCNCTSPDTGNMEVLARFGSEEQKRQYLEPLLAGEIRSCFAMTEPDVASSDASNIGIEIRREGEEYVINGSKWWITGAGSLHCKIMILMGKTDPTAQKYAQQSQILVPMDTPGITLIRPMTVFGEDDAPKGHMEIEFSDCRVPVSNALLGEGRGFEISQARLGPGRIHHCMRLIGQCERAVALLCTRVESRTAFGRKLSTFDTILLQVGQCRAEIEQARLLVREAADQMDTHGNADGHTRKLLSLTKAVVPEMAQRLIDRVIQAHGAMGVSQDTFLTEAFTSARTLRLADGPDEVHWRTAGRLELTQQGASDQRLSGSGALQKVGDYGDANRAAARMAPFRRSGDPISRAALERIAAVEHSSKL